MASNSQASQLPKIILLPVQLFVYRMALTDTLINLFVSLSPIFLTGAVSLP
jgi:hypothetical protein